MRRFLLTLPLAAILFSAQPMAEPKYTKDGELLPPPNYRQWQFVGSNLGIGYNDPGETKRTETFKNIYIQPEAFQTYRSTGKFPEKTMLVMEVFSSGDKASPAKTGHFEEKFIGIETAVKDSSRFPTEKWAYYNFIASGGGARATAKAFPKDACWSCHAEHAKVDNVFVQFYPVLRDK